MCGVTGFLSTSSLDESAELVVEEMARAIARRGPDDQGTWVDRYAGIALGHRRLAIVDLTAAGHQPMVSASGRYVLSFNGEIYNHDELRQMLYAKGTQNWRGHSDTESLLEAFDAWGIPETLNKAVGMFAIALWDRKTSRLTLARDRAGEKPMYYGWQHGTFLFGSQLKALKRHPRFLARINRSSLTLFLRHNFIPCPYSIYEGIFKLPPGTWIQVSRDGVDPDPRPYWSTGEIAKQGAAEPFCGTDGEAVDVLEDVLKSAVRGQMMSDVPLGALLSGGLDSSMVTALMQSVSSSSVRTFTIGFEEGAYDEAIHAKAVARHLGTQHTELRLTGNDAQALIPTLSETYDEPFADSSQLPTYLVMQLARQQVTVALSGDAGDELFGGYNRYLHAPKLWKRLGWLPFGMRHLIGKSILAVPPAVIDRAAGPFAGLTGIAHPGEKTHKLARRLTTVRNLDEFCLSLLTEWPNAEVMVLGGQVPPNLIDEPDRWPPLNDPVTRMMAMDAVHYLPDDILVKVDRAAMAVSLETRAPFLDRDVMKFAWSLPMHMKIRNGQGKWIIRQLLDRYVPRHLVERPKMGFAIPIDTWLRGPLKEWAEHLLDPRRLKADSYFNTQLTREAWDAHQRNEGAYGHRLWSILMFQSWLDHNA